MTILPIALVLGLGLVAAIVWAMAGLVSKRDRSGRLFNLRAIVLMLSCIAGWLGVTFAIYVLGGLTHSSHAFRDCLPWYILAFVIFLLVPSGLVAWSWQRSRRLKSGDGRPIG